MHIVRQEPLQNMPNAEYTSTWLKVKMAVLHWLPFGGTTKTLVIALPNQRQVYETSQYSDSHKLQLSLLYCRNI